MTDVSESEQLPVGWQIAVSKRYPERIYYFNNITGDSSWDPPELEPSKTSQQYKQANIPKPINRERSTSAENTYQLLKKASDKLLAHKSKTLHNEVPNSQNFRKKRSSSEANFSKSHMPPTAVVAPVIQKSKKDSATNVCRQNENQKKGLKRTAVVLNDTPCELSNLKTGERKKKRTNQLKKNSDCVDSTKDVITIEDADSTSEPKENDDKDTEDIEMFDVSMECIDDLTTKSETVFDAFAKYYIVVDTNVLISKLHLIDELKDTPLDGCGPPHIFIPWVVFEELDKLKSARSSKNTMKAAIEAIRYLNLVLKSKHPRFHGQSPVQFEQWAKSYSKINDDKILECCMGLADITSKEKVILLTNDKNLVNKALICDINVHDWVSMMEKVKPDVLINTSKHTGKRSSNADRHSEKVNTPGETSKASKSVQDTPEDRALQSKRDLCKRDIHTLMSTARQLLKDVLTEFIKKEMFEAYGEIWHSFPVEMKLLKGILGVVQKYWKMVFSEIFNEKDKRNFELLSEKVCRPEGFLGDKDECLIILSTIEDIFCQIKRRSNNSNIPVEKIQDFRVSCLNTFIKFNKIESTIRDTEFKDVHAVFEQNWGIINQLSGLVMDFCKVPHDFQYEKPEQMPSEAEFRVLMCNLIPGVEQIKTTMAQAVECVHNNKTTKQGLKKLANSLLQFIPSLKISCDIVPHQHFTAKTLEKFCMHPQNRQMIDIGFKQIEKFHLKLDEALHAMMKEPFNKGSESPETMLLD